MNLVEKIGEKLKELFIGFPFLCHRIGISRSVKPLSLVLLLTLSVISSDI